MNEILDAFDHPVTFVFLLMLALAGLSSIVYYIFKAGGVQGAASTLRHP